MLFESDRAGYRSHGSWGAESDYYVMFFDVDAYDRFTMSKEDKEILEEAEKEAKKNEKADDKDSKKKKDKKKTAEKPKAEKLLTFDLDNRLDRIIRVTDNSGQMGDAILKGDTLYYQASYEGDNDLWVHYIREDKTERLMKGVGRGRMQADKKFDNLFYHTRWYQETGAWVRNLPRISISRPCSTIVLTRSVPTCSTTSGARLRISSM